jgi:hypothetical protein
MRALYQFVSKKTPTVSITVAVSRGEVVGSRSVTSLSLLWLRSVTSLRSSGVTLRRRGAWRCGDASGRRPGAAGGGLTSATRTPAGRG